MKRFKLEHKRQRKYKVALFLFIVLLTSAVYLNYGRPTGLVTGSSDGNVLLYNALENEQVRLFVASHPDYKVAIREIDYVQLQYAKMWHPTVYSGLDGKHYEVELFSSSAVVVAVLDSEATVVRVYNPYVE